MKEIELAHLRKHRSRPDSDPHHSRAVTTLQLRMCTPHGAQDQYEDKVVSAATAKNILENPANRPASSRGGRKKKVEDVEVSPTIRSFRAMSVEHGAATKTTLDTIQEKSYPVGERKRTTSRFFSRLRKRQENEHHSKE